MEYKGKVYGIPFTSNTQLLWYRKDKVDAPPEDFTWDEMIDDALAKKTHVEVQARQYEGLTVWVNALIAGAGGQIVNQAGDVKVDDTAKTAAEIDQQAGQVGGGAARHVHQRRGPGAPGLRGGPLVLRGQLPVRLSERGATSARTSRRTWAGRATRARDKDEPSRPPLGGINIGVSKYSETPDLAFEAAECIANEQHQGDAAELGGLPPTTESVYETDAGQEGLPVRRPAARVDRGRRAAPGDARLQRHLAGDPEDATARLTASIPTGSWRS